MSAPLSATGPFDHNFNSLEFFYTHFVLAEKIFLLEGEQDHISEISRVFDMDVFSAVLQHTGCLVYNPVWAEDGYDELSSCLTHVCIYINSEVFFGVAGEADRE